MADPCLTAVAGSGPTGPLGWLLALAIVAVMVLALYLGLRAALILTSKLRGGRGPRTLAAFGRSASLTWASWSCLGSVAWSCWRSGGGAARFGASAGATAHSVGGWRR